MLCAGATGIDSCQVSAKWMSNRLCDVYRVIRVDHLLSIQMDYGICMVLHRSETVVLLRTIQVWAVINEYSCPQLRCLYTGECILLVDRNNNEWSCKLLIADVRNTTTCSDNFIDVNKGHNFIIWVLSGCSNIYDSLLVLIERLLNYLLIKLYGRICDKL
jgi:hypothetical protein